MSAKPIIVTGAAGDLGRRPQVTLEAGIAAYGKWLEARARSRAA